MPSRTVLRASRRSRRCDSRLAGRRSDGRALASAAGSCALSAATALPSPALPWATLCNPCCRLDGLPPFPPLFPPWSKRILHGRLRSGPPGLRPPRAKGQRFEPLGRTISTRCLIRVSGGSRLELHVRPTLSRGHAGNMVQQQLPARLRRAISTRIAAGPPYGVLREVCSAFAAGFRRFWNPPLP
jgi:hypothetical protein